MRMPPPRAKVAISIGTWAVAAALLVVYSFTKQMPLGAWGLFFSAIAADVTAIFYIHHERIRAADIAAIAIDRSREILDGEHERAPLHAVRDR